MVAALAAVLLLALLAIGLLGSAAAAIGHPGGDTMTAYMGGMCH